MSSPASCYKPTKTGAGGLVNLRRLMRRTQEVAPVAPLPEAELQLEKNHQAAEKLELEAGQSVLSDGSVH